MTKIKECPTKECGYQTKSSSYKYCPKCGNVLMSYTSDPTPLNTCPNHNLCELHDLFDPNLCTGTVTHPNCTKMVIIQNDNLDFAIRQLRVGLKRNGWKVPSPKELSDTSNGAGFDQLEKETMKTHRENQ